VWAGGAGRVVIGSGQYCRLVLLINESRRKSIIIKCYTQVYFSKHVKFQGLGVPGYGQKYVEIARQKRKILSEP
jgi:hypothetical protein